MLADHWLPRNARQGRRRRSPTRAGRRKAYSVFRAAPARRSCGQLDPDPTKLAGVLATAVNEIFARHFDERCGLVARQPAEIQHRIAVRPDRQVVEHVCDDVDELISARQHLRPAWRPSIRQRHFNEGLFNGFDFTTMLRIGSMNMALHAVHGANATHRDSPRRDVAAQARNASPRCNGGAAELTRNSVDRPIPALGKDVQDLISPLLFRTGRSVHRSYISADR
jgi:hypothetical protein